MRLAVRFDQVRDDPRPVAFAADAAFQQEVGVQHRRARQDGHVRGAEARHLRHRFFGQPFTEPARAEFAIEGHERHHGELRDQYVFPWALSPEP